MISITSAVLLVGQPSRVGNAQAADPQALIEKYTELLRKHFTKFKRGTIALYDGSANYQIADVWDSDMTRLMERGSTCFSRVPTSVHEDAIPSLTFEEEESVGIILGIRRFFHLSTEGALQTVVRMRFDDVSEQIVSEGELRRAAYLLSDGHWAIVCGQAKHYHTIQ